MESLLKKQRPCYETLYTVFCEVERILNSTPLFHVPVDPTDDDVLTPYHFLIGRPTPPILLEFLSNEKFRCGKDGDVRKP